MPATEPAPSGTCWAYAAQPVPTRPAAGSAAAVMGALDDELLITLEDMLLAPLETELAVELASSFEHAAVPMTATAVRPSAAIALRCAEFMT
ncbi:hypothetical protein JCM12141A_44750 [Mycolicibacterium hodleri]